MEKNVDKKIEAYSQLAKALKIPLQTAKAVLPVGAALVIGTPLAQAATIYSGIQNIAVHDTMTCTDAIPNVVPQDIGGGAAADVSWRNNGFGAGPNDVQIQIQNAPGGFDINGFVGDTIFTFGNIYAYPYALTINAVIGPAQPFGFGNAFRNELVNAPAYTGSHWGNGNLNSGDVRFLGFRFDNAGTSNYGWMRIQYNDDCDILIIDWAYEDSGATITPATTLPVSLTSFQVEKLGMDAILNWTTESEQENSGFEVQRSENGRDFETITWVEGNGTTQSSSNYTLKDKALRGGKTYYYRLKQVDFSGTFEYSKVITIDFASQQNNMGELFPTPSMGQVNFSYEAIEAAPLSIEVHDLNGRLVSEVQTEAVVGSQIFNLNLSELERGIYFVKVDDGIKPIYRKLVLQ